MTRPTHDLPPPIDSIIVPDSFSVSNLASLERCALSVLGMESTDGVRASAVLLPHPLALLGTILHHARAEVREGRWGEAATPVEAFRNLFEDAVLSAEEELGNLGYAAGLAPLRDAVGRRAWMMRTEQMERWASSLDDVTPSRDPPIPLGRLLGGPKPKRASDAVADLQADFGAESPLHDRELRLRGRPDWVEQHGSGHLVVSDFKSGKVVDDDGNILDEHIVQVQAYSLMLERARPGVRVEPFVEGRERVSVPWDRPNRIRLLERLRRLHAKLPPGQSLPARDLASPGSHCRFCQLRPICPRYLRDMPAWWPDGASAVRPLPLDVWGIVEEVRHARMGTAIRLKDASGRRVLVDGLSDELGLSQALVGDAIWFFDLEASEDLEQHGTRIQPRNFHQISPGPRWSSARRLRAFLRREPSPREAP